MKWKFFYNGYAWWLRITDFEQLCEYFKQTSGKFGEAAARCALTDSANHYSDELSAYIGIMSANTGKGIIDTMNDISSAVCDTYIKIITEKGFVNVNSVGGCNGCDWPEKMVEYRDNLIFPNYTKKDIKIKTWEMTDKMMGNERGNYNYHYYVYMGGIQLRDGEKEKWDTRKEAEEFVEKYCEKNGIK